MMDTFIEQTSEELEKCQQKLLASEDALRETEEKLKSREEELRASEEVHGDMKDTLRESEEELRSSQEALGDMKVQMRETSEALEETLTTVSHLETELTRLRGVLRSTWQEGDQIAAHLAERRLRSEDDKSRTQQEQKTELSSFKEFARKLQQDHATLAEDLKEERAVVCSLSALLQQEKSESAERMRDFEDEMEEVLGELAAMQGQEQRWRDTLAEHHAALLSLGRDHAMMETELNETRALLECKRRCEMNHHSMALESLQEEHTYSQHVRGEHQASCGTSRGQEDHSTRGHAKDPYTP